MILMNTILLAQSPEFDCEVDDLIFRFFVDALNESSEPETLDNIDEEFETSINMILLFKELEFTPY